MLDARPSNFCVGVAGYPEKHFEAPNLKLDIARTKEKVDAGAEYIVTQMFFDNRAYFEYVEQCRAAGIKVPIIPGLKIVTTHHNLNSLPRHFHVDIPEQLAEEVATAKPEHVLEVGVNWAARQVEELLAKNVPSVHFYIMQNSRPINQLMKKIKF